MFERILLLYVKGVKDVKDYVRKYAGICVVWRLGVGTRDLTLR